jgi:hypothetical protein
MATDHHESGADILTIIRNWHRAVDGRGLSESERSQFSILSGYEMLALR